LRAVFDIPKPQLFLVIVLVSVPELADFITAFVLAIFNPADIPVIVHIFFVAIIPIALVPSVALLIIMILRVVVVEPFPNSLLVVIQGPFGS